MPEQPIRQQVLVGDMPKLVRDLVCQTLADAGVEIVPSEAGFRPTPPGAPPPILIVAESRRNRAQERSWLRSRPEAVILGVEQHGRTVAISMLQPCRREPVELTKASLMAAVASQPTWEERFG
jgi:hypothetical protein